MGRPKNRTVFSKVFNSRICYKKWSSSLKLVVYLERSVVTLKLRKEYLKTVSHNTSVLLWIKSWTVWYIERYSVSTCTGVINCQKQSGFFGPPCMYGHQVHCTCTCRHVVGQVNVWCMWSKIDVPSRAMSRRSNRLVGLSYSEHKLQRTTLMSLTTRWPTTWPRQNPLKVGVNRKFQTKTRKSKNRTVSESVNLIKPKFEDIAATINYTSWVVYHYLIANPTWLTAAILKSAVTS